MKPEEQNFEEEWRKAFEEASVPPPEKIWKNIEYELDKKRRRPFVFFFARPTLVAGGLAAILLMVWGGISWFNSTNIHIPDKQSKNISQKIENKKGEIAETKKENATKSSQNLLKKLNQTEKLAKKDNEKINEKKQAFKLPITLLNRENNFAKLSKNKPSITTYPNNNSSSQLIKTSGNKITEATILAKDNSQKMSNEVIMNQNTAKEIVTESKILSQNQNLMALKGKDFYIFGSRYTLDRNKLSFDTEVEEVKENLAFNQSKLYVGIQSGIAPFDPNMKLDGLATTARVRAEQFARASADVAVIDPGGTGMKPTTNTLIPVTTPKNVIKAGLSNQYSLNIGYKFSKNWAVEGGLRYWQGNSTLSSNAYTFNDSGYRNTFLADYLSEKSNNSTYSYVNSNTTALSGKQTGGNLSTVIADGDELTNHYEYLTIPVQMSYSIMPKKKVNFSILGGLAADIFLENSIYGNNNFIVKTTFNQSSNIYKMVNISGLGGIRTNYQVDKHWQATLGASYQQALSSGIKASTELQMQMRLWGIQAGLNYRF